MINYSPFVNLRYRRRRRLYSSGQNIDDQFSIANVLGIIIRMLE